jgi:heme-degrading monooxygenase HmoA
MNMYKTYGSTDYLYRLKEGILEGDALLLSDEEDRSVLLHETDGKSTFHEGTSYDVIDSAGRFSDAGFAVLNNIPVSKEGRSLFEYRFQKRAGLIEKEPGFVAIRVLRPLENDTYVILTLWESERDFLKWKESKAYNEAHKKRGASDGIDKQSIFPRPSYAAKYSVLTD